MLVLATDKTSLQVDTLQSHYNHDNIAVKSRKAVFITVYFTSKQLQHFGFAKKNGPMTRRKTTMIIYAKIKYFISDYTFIFNLYYIFFAYSTITYNTLYVIEFVFDPLLWLRHKDVHVHGQTWSMAQQQSQ